MPNNHYYSSPLDTHDLSDEVLASDAKTETLNYYKAEKRSMMTESKVISSLTVILYSWVKEGSKILLTRSFQTVIQLNFRSNTSTRSARFLMLIISTIGQSSCC